MSHLNWVGKSFLLQQSRTGQLNFKKRKRELPLILQSSKHFKTLVNKSINLYYKVLNHIQRRLKARCTIREKTNWSLQSSRRQQWAGKTPQGEETWSRPRLWRAAVCFDRLGWKGNRKQWETAIEKETKRQESGSGTIQWFTKLLLYRLIQYAHISHLDSPYNVKKKKKNQTCNLSYTQS